MNLRRSITFWSGLLVMGFVCWCSWDSMKNVSAIVHGGLGIYQAEGGVAVCFADEELFGQGVFRISGANRAELSVNDTINFRELPEGERATPWIKPMLATADHEVTCFIPHWLILFTVVAVWLLLLFMRARRRNKSVIKQ